MANENASKARFSTCTHLHHLIPFPSTSRCGTSGRPSIFLKTSFRSRPPYGASPSLPTAPFMLQIGFKTGGTVPLLDLASNACPQTLHTIQVYGLRICCAHRIPATIFDARDAPCHTRYSAKETCGLHSCCNTCISPEDQRVGAASHGRTNIMTTWRISASS